mgnify:CR=1 FL=1
METLTSEQVKLRKQTLPKHDFAEKDKDQKLINNGKRQLDN